VEDDPQVRHVGAITQFEHPRAGRVKTVAPAVQLSATPAAISRHAPLVGEHTREVLAEFDVTAKEIDALIESGAADQA